MDGVSGGTDFSDVLPNLAEQVVGLGCTNEGNGSLTNQSQKCSVRPEFFPKIRSESLKVATLITPRGHRSSGRQYVRAYKLLSQVPTYVLELVVSILNWQLGKSKTDLRFNFRWASHSVSPRPMIHFIFS